jgi:hypothetical protein
MARDACTVFHWKPRNGKSVNGTRLDFSQWMMKPLVYEEMKGFQRVFQVDIL